MILVVAITIYIIELLLTSVICYNSDHANKKEVLYDVFYCVLWPVFIAYGIYCDCTERF